MEKTLNEQVNELLAQVEKTIVTAIQNGAKIEKKGSSNIMIDDLLIYKSYDEPARIFHCTYFNNPCITGLFRPSLEQLKAKQEELYKQIKDINIQIAERDEQ